MFKIIRECPTLFLYLARWDNRHRPKTPQNLIVLFPLPKPTGKGGFNKSEAFGNGRQSLAGLSEDHSIGNDFFAKARWTSPFLAQASICFLGYSLG